MSPRVEEFPACGSCGGKLFPLVLCDKCGAASILHDAQQLDWAAACPDCGTFNPWQLICDQCHSRFPPPGARAEPSPPTAAPPPEAPPPAPPSRPKRRIRGDFDRAALLDMLQVFGLDAPRAQSLIDRGYNALWKIARASETDLARIPEVGPVAARKLKASFHLLNYSPPQRTKEQIAQDDCECPLCGCMTSAFAPSCPECGTMFEEEEMDEDIRTQFADEGDAGLVAFYDGRLAQKPEDPNLWYARGLLLETLGRIDEAIESLDRAAAKDPEAKKIKVAELRLQAKEVRKPEAVERLRSAANALLDDLAWEQEVARLDQLLSEATAECAECGASLPPDATRCSSCGAPVGALPERPAAEPPKPSASQELDVLVDDLLVGELEESLSPEELERTKAAVLDWLIEELEESMASDELSRSPKEKPAADEASPEEPPAAASVGFLKGWMRGSRGLVSGLRPKRGGRVPPGKVNGLVNGMGRVNGLVNGVGRVNGLVNGLAQSAGRVNGLAVSRGRVNGLAGSQGRINGRVNGTAFAPGGRKFIRLPSPSRRVRYLGIASGLLIAILIAGVLFVPVPGPQPPILIDGAFDDWAAVAMFDAATAASDLNVSIARYADLLDQDHGALYLFASTRGGTLADSAGYDGMYFLIDADNDTSTGFVFGGVGADAAVEVFGGNYRVEGARLYSFPSGAEANWSQRQLGGSAQAAASAQGLEVKVSTDDIVRFDSARFRILVYADDFGGSSSRSKAFLTATGGAVLLELQPLSSVVGGTPTALFEIHVHALGLRASDAWDVSNFTMTATPGAVVSLSAESVTMTQGRPNATITASVSAPGFFPGTIVEVNVTNAVVANAAPGIPVVVRGGPVRAYVLAPPSSVRIDGLFADWVGKDNADTDPARVNDSQVDILRYGAAVDASTAFFHVAVAGDLLAGRLPQRLIPSPPGPGGNGSGGTPTPLPRVTGEDLLRVYIDLNASDARGDPIGGIYADYLFEIRGEGGRITSRAFFAWTGAWTTVSLPAVALEKDAADIEGSLAIGPTTNFTRMVFAMTDWAGIGDVTPPANATVQSPAPPFQMSGVTVDAPEFHEIAVPVAGTILVVLLLARRRRRGD